MRRSLGARAIHPGVVLVVGLLAGAAEAARLERAVADDPTVVDIGLTAQPGRGIAPLPVRFEVAWYRPGADRILRVDWDFQDDGIVDASGFAVSHVFEEPGAYAVVARIVTRAHGTFARRGIVRVHSAMMTFAFDDGHVTQVLYALPALRARGVVGTAYVVPQWIEWREQGTSTLYLSWAELRQLGDAGWDIGSHTLTHPHLPELSEEGIRDELELSRQALVDHGFAAPHFALPHGAYDARVLALVPQYYASNRATGNAVNPHPASADPWMLVTKGTNWFKTIEEYREYVDEAVGAGGWLILNSHIVAPECGTTPYCVESAMLQAVLDYAEARGVGVGTVDEILSGAWTRDPTWFEPGATARRPVAPELVVRRVGRGPGADRGDVVLRAAGAGIWTITVHDVAGRRVAQLHDGFLPPGEHAFPWDGREGTGARAGSGVYFIRAAERSGGPVAAKTLLLR